MAEGKRSKLAPVTARTDQHHAFERGLKGFLDALLAMDPAQAFATLAIIRARLAASETPKGGE